MEYEIKVIVPNAEAQMAFCNKLAMYDLRKNIVLNNGNDILGMNINSEYKEEKL